MTKQVAESLEHGKISVNVGCVVCTLIENHLRNAVLFLYLAALCAQDIGIVLLASLEWRE